MRFLLLPLIPLLLSCSGGTERRIRLADGYADILRFRDRSVGTDSTTIRRGIDSILTRYGLTPEQYVGAFRELAEDPAAIQPFFQRVEARLAATSSAASKSADRPGNYSR